MYLNKRQTNQSSNECSKTGKKNIKSFNGENNVFSGDDHCSFMCDPLSDQIEGMSFFYSIAHFRIL
jgi:hypothetical protein